MKTYEQKLREAKCELINEINVLKREYKQMQLEGANPIPLEIKRVSLIMKEVDLKNIRFKQL